MTFISINCFAKELGVSGCSIAKVQDHKMYLKPGTIQLANNGIFINVEGQLRAVNHLELNEQGLYFDLSRQMSLDNLCPVCNLPLLWGFASTQLLPAKG